MATNLVNRALAAATAAGLALGVLSAFAAPAQAAYPPTQCDVAVHPTVAVGGHDVTVTGSANRVVDWTVVFGPKAKVETSARGSARAASGRLQTATGHGNTFRHVFSTPRVKKATKYSAKVTCTDGGTKYTTVTLLKDPATGAGGGAGDGNGSGNAGGLPGTGGPALWIALLAAGLVVEGTRRVRKARSAQAG